MTNEKSWLPETVMNLLKNSEAHYRSIGFRRVASHMASTIRAASEEGTVHPEFYRKYVRCLTDDAVQLIRTFGFTKDVTDYFADSMVRSIRLTEQMLSELDSAGRTPTFNGTTGRKEDAEAFRDFFSASELMDPVASGPEVSDILNSAEPFFGLVYEHSFLPGKEYLVSQLDLAVGHERMLTISEELLSVEKAIRENGEVYADFSYAQTHPGDLSDDATAWRIMDGFDVPIDRFSRWAYFMYYKIPILTAMLPVHNIIFFSLVQDTIEKRSSGRRRYSV